MPRPRLNLDAHKEEIRRRIYDSDETLDDIVEYLEWVTEASVSRSTLLRRCKEWGFQQKGQSLSTELIELIRLSFFSTQLSDLEIAEDLQDSGFIASANQVKVVRLAHGWKRRSNTVEELQKQWDDCVVALQHALAEGTIRSYGHQLLSAHLRRQQTRVRIADLKLAIRQLDGENVRNRRPGMETASRGEYITDGPNDVWSVDQYDKLKKWGIGVYGGIDAYSRRLLWVYAGISNRTQISVAKQFCITVQTYNVFPRIVRSDRGVETAIMADVQYSLGVYDKHNQGLTPVDRHGNPLDEWPLNEFYVYGTSTKNVRIETWWGQLRRGQTGNWQV
jgi:hypothetical protein